MNDLTFDKASYRNKRSLLQKIITLYKTKRFFSKVGIGNVIKRSAEFVLTDNAYLEIGSNCVIQDYSYFQLTKPEPKVIIGDNVVIGRGCMITAKSLVRIGDNTIIGAYVQIIDCSHGFARDKLIKEQSAVIKKVTIGRDCWIGTGAKILMGVNIGNGAVIGANAVVTNNIAPYAIAVGVPAREVKYRMNDRIGVILQARMGSKRLPGKVMKLLGKVVMLEYIVKRLLLVLHNTMLIVATSSEKQDDIIESQCLLYGVECFRGSESDVLDRYYSCALKYGFTHIVRLTGDNPFIDVKELGNLIDLHLNSHADYSTSKDVMPVGVGAEIFTFDALKKSFLFGNKPNHREHVNEYILENMSLFNIKVLNVSETKNRAEVRLTVDDNYDYQKACFIVDNSQHDSVSTEEAIFLGLKFDNELKPCS